MAGIRRGLILFRLLLLSGVFVVYDVTAQTYSTACTQPGGACDEGAAYSVCMSNVALHAATYGNNGNTCAKAPNQTVKHWKTVGSTGSDIYLNGVSPNYYFGALCANRPDETGWLDPDPNDNSAPVYCFNGCKYEGATVSGGPGSVVWVPTGPVCTSLDVPEPSIDTDGDGVVDEDDAFPNDPNESADTDGDGIGDNADFSPDDPTDGADSPGEEDGDDEGDNTASGGGDCKAPPSCKGDGIQCNQLFQQWQIRCSGATVTGDPTNCASGYSCSGDSVQCATVALLRKTACAAAGDGEGGTGETPGDANGNGVADVLEGSGAGDTGDPGESDNVTRFGIGVDASLLDQENIFGAGSCPAPPSLTIMGKTTSGSDFPYWCEAMAILRALILIFGAFIAVKILTGWGFS